MKLLKISVAIVLLGTSFLGGVIYSKFTLLENGSFRLERPLVLGSAPNTGLLPEGTILYSYSNGPSINTYIVFVNTHNLNALKRVEFEHMFSG